MGRVLTVYGALAIIALFVASNVGYPQPGIQEKRPFQGPAQIDQLAAASDTQLQVKGAQQSTAVDESSVYLESEQQTEQTRLTERQTDKIFTPSEPEGGSQTFFPSFSIFDNPPLGHSRPFLYQQEAAYSQRPAAYRQQLTYDNLKYNNPFRRDNFQAAADATHSLLGSGNFGVIRGGTFYGDSDAESTDYNAGRYNTYTPYFHNNGHGRPAYYFGATNPRPQQHEQFANFRDFADINTPSNPAYSQFVVVYVNKNGSTLEVPKKVAEPKNIIERLAMLDLEVKKKEETKPVKKLSASKRKLALLPPEKKTANKKTTTSAPTDLYEPLLALS